MRGERVNMFLNSFFTRHLEVKYHLAPTLKDTSEGLRWRKWKGEEQAHASLMMGIHTGSICWWWQHPILRPELNYALNSEILNDIINSQGWFSLNIEYARNCTSKWMLTPSKLRLAEATLYLFKLFENDPLWHAEQVYELHKKDSIVILRKIIAAHLAGKGL